MADPTPPVDAKPPQVAAVVPPPPPPAHKVVEIAAGAPPTVREQLAAAGVKPSLCSAFYARAWALHRYTPESRLPRDEFEKLLDDALHGPL